LGASAATCTAIGGGVTYLNDEYQGPLAIGRVDNTFGPLASVKYLATQNVTLGFDYRNVAFSSQGGMTTPPFVSVNALPYNRNIYMFSMNARC
jgi:hypothetical protein